MVDNLGENTGSRKVNLSFAANLVRMKRKRDRKELSVFKLSKVL